MTGYQNYPGMDDSANNELTNPPNLMDIKPAKRINAIVQAFRHRFIAEYAPIITRRPINSAKAKYGLKLNDYVIYMDPTKNPSRWERGIVAKVYPGKDFAIRVADIKLKNGTLLEKRPAHLLAKLDIRLEDPAAESNKYASCNITVKKYLNFIKSRGSHHSKQQFSKSTNMPKDQKKLIFFNKFDTNSDINMQRAMNIQLTEQQQREYLDKSGENIIYATNFPAKYGAGDVYGVMSEFGVVKLIVSINWNGSRHFNCFIGYEDKASVSTALLWSESQVICADNRAHRQTFSKLNKKFQVTKVVTKPIFAFLDMHVECKIPQRVLLITTSVPDSRGLHKTIPVTSQSGGFISVCSRTEKYNFEMIDIDMSKGNMEIQRLETVPKATNVAPCVHEVANNVTSTNKSRKVSSHNGNIVVNIVSNPPFDPLDYGQHRQPDLREIIEKRKELNLLRRKLCTPTHR